MPRWKPWKRRKLRQRTVPMVRIRWDSNFAPQFLKGCFGAAPWLLDCVFGAGSTTSLDLIFCIPVHLMEPKSPMEPSLPPLQKA